MVVFIKTTFILTYLILTIRLPYTMYIDAKSARCWKNSPEDSQIHFPPGSTFQLNRQGVSTGLSFINTLCTRSEKNLPILMENNKNHQITLPRGRIGFSFLDVLDREEPKYQPPSPYELTNAIITTDERYSDCFFCILQSLLSLAMNFYRLCMEMKIQLFSNPIQSRIASQLMLK